MARQYNDPINGIESSVGEQLNVFKYYRVALQEARKEQYFMQLADVKNMPKNMGKTMKQFHYLPLLSDENINDQGIDAAGNPIQNGNLYGSSKDVGTITGKLPLVGENGGRVNRVGFKRKDIEGSIVRMGFFDEYTEESVNFDTDAELMMHISRETINGAHEITEDVLQIDLLQSAGVIRYPGDATEDSELTAEHEVTYGDILRLGIDLDNNRTPKHTKILTGVRMIDTRVIPGARVLYVGSELLPTLMAMTDFHGEKAFIEVQHYAANGGVLNGEAGAIAGFRVVVVPEMLHWEGAGADVGDVDTHYETGGKFDVFPLLCVGNESFSTIGFQTDGKTVKFRITHKKPGYEQASTDDPYGQKGFMSIMWYYGFLLQRPERIGLIKTTASL